ncbi:MAG: sigma-70 family RNA polymerase sigma factor [Pirellulales bacterium]|nr:sigma-70 family RNA polymerase sigma factor [Pirellulales bacterium]
MGADHVSMSSRELLSLYQAGNREAATILFDRYVARLMALARRRLGERLRRRVDAEDIVQSAFRSFFAHSTDGEYEFAVAGDLWRLLASITINKLHGEIEKHTAARRSIHREEPASVFAANTKAPEPSAAEIIALVEEIQLAFDGLSPDERLVFTLSLEGQSLEQISVAIRKSVRTTRRIVANIEKGIQLRLTTGRRTEPARPAALPAPDAPLLFSDYVLERLLGSGGMGKVFRARDKRTGKLVAIKALHKSRQSDVRAVSRLVQEAQILAGLRHPHIVGVQGLGRFPSGGYFMVMEYVDGVDLQSRIHTSGLPVEEMLRVAKQVADAVYFAHERGVVHCDLKPGNVLLDKEGHVFVTDFGFAHLVAGPADRLSRGIGGTAGFIAPELLAGESPPTPAADVFGLGMLMWTVATGYPPSGIDSSSEYNCVVEGLERIIRRCVATLPNERYGSVRELIRDLESVVI